MRRIATQLSLIVSLILAPVVMAQSTATLEATVSEAVPGIAHLKISTVDNFVILRGEAPDQMSLTKAESVLRRESDLSVLNVMTVARKISDAEILRSVERALHLNENLDSAEISVSAAEGVVELTGSVEGQLEYEAAADIASTIEGVVLVENRLRKTS